MSHFRLGVVPYVNGMPLWVALEKNLVTTSNTFTFEKAVPDRLARDLLAGQVDLALLSIVEAFKHPRMRVIDGVCIGSRGAVETVQLFHRKPLSACSRVLLDRDSRTSAQLAKILLTERFPLASRMFDSGRVDPANLRGAAPLTQNGAATAPLQLSPLEQGDAVDRGEIAPTPLESSGGGIGQPLGGSGRLAASGRVGVSAAADLDDCDAFLSIGDKTWDFLKSDWDHTDLGLLWTDMTGLPMVWAAWLTGEATQTKDLASILQRARDAGLTILDDIIRRLSRSAELDREQMLRYLTEVVHYKLGMEEKAAIQKLQEIGHAQGLFPPPRRIAYLD